MESPLSRPRRLPLGQLASCEVIHEFTSGGDLIQSRLRPSRCIRCEPFNGFLDGTGKPFCESMDRNFLNSLLPEGPNGLNYDSCLRSRTHHFRRRNVPE